MSQCAGWCVDSSARCARASARASATFGLRAPFATAAISPALLVVMALTATRYRGVR